MINPNRPEHLAQLVQAMDKSRYHALSFRQNRVSNLIAYAGDRYSTGTEGQKVSLNCLQLFVQIVLRQLVPSTPRCMCSTTEMPYKPIAADMEAWMAKASDGLRLDETLSRFVLDAMFLIGIVKIAECAVSEKDVGGVLHYVGQPFCETVDFDDYYYDSLAKSRDQFEFEGNRYRVPLEWVRENKDFNKQAREKVTPMYRRLYNEYGDIRPTSLSAPLYFPSSEEIEDHVEIRDVFLSKEQLVVTLEAPEHVQGGSSGPPLKVMEWTGPREGPYHKLGLMDLPDNPIPIGPVTTMRNLHEQINRVMNKLQQQSDRQKTITVYQGGATEDARRISNASDGELIRSDFPDRVREVKYGGADRDQMLFLESLRQIFNFHGGNLASMGGLSPETSTFHGDQLLKESASGQIQEMQSRVTKSFGGIFKALGFHWWKNPTLAYRTSRQVAGIDIPVNLTPQMRQIPWEMLNIEADPYSLQPATPQQRANDLTQILTQLLLPGSAAMAQQGVSIKWPELLKILADYKNMPDLATILNVGPPPSQQTPMARAQQDADQPPMPAQTTRHTIRTSRPQPSGDKAHGQVLSQLLSGGGNAQQKAGFMK